MQNHWFHSSNKTASFVIHIYSYAQSKYDNFSLTLNIHSQHLFVCFVFVGVFLAAFKNYVFLSANVYCYSQYNCVYNNVLSKQKQSGERTTTNPPKREKKVFTWYFFCLTRPSHTAVIVMRIHLSTFDVCLWRFTAFFQSFVYGDV